MYRVLFFWLWFASTAAGSIIDSSIWVNEVHYDNEGADQNEFVEVVVPRSLTALSDITLTLYNGSSGSAYGGPTALTDFTPGDTVDGFALYTWEVALQNGAPDGLALARGTQVLQFLSYEGTFTATDGVAQGLLSTDLGVQEDTTAALGSSLQLSGVGDSYLDFAWLPSAPQTPGSLNHSQSFAVPEPASLVAWMVMGGSIALFCRTWRRACRSSRSSC